MLGVFHPHPWVALYSSLSCPLPRNDDLYGRNRGHWRQRGGRREDGVFIFLAPSLLVTAGWLCPSTQSHSSCQAALPSLSPGTVHLTLCPFRALGGESCLVLLAAEEESTPDGRVQPYEASGKCLSVNPFQSPLLCVSSVSCLSVFPATTLRETSDGSG